jgi:hypothetical protein
LPEPLLTTPDVAEDVELADSVPFAMLVVLETLTPLERAVFLLREVFGFEYEEIARATDKTQAAVRQVASRANGAAAMFLSIDGQLDSVASFTVTDGRIAEIYVVRNPDKLTAVRETFEVTRG